MSAFAYISLFDAISKLAIAFVILLNPIDRLVYYGALVLVAGIIQRYLYVLYCRKHFSECRYTLIFDRKITKEMFGFAGWNFIGASSAVLRDQGGNILINMFCGATVNAARGIAMSVNSAVYGFVANFMIALNPQITKNYASGDYGYMFSLAFQGARLSYYILLILSLPIFVTTPYRTCVEFYTVGAIVYNERIVGITFSHYNVGNWKDKELPANSRRSAAA